MRRPAIHPNSYALYDYICNSEKTYTKLVTLIRDVRAQAKKSKVHPLPLADRDFVIWKIEDIVSLARADYRKNFPMEWREFVQALFFVPLSDVFRIALRHIDR